MNAFPITAPQETFLGVYRATRVLGEGGMGQVFLGRHVKTGQEVVIKVMHDHLAQVPSVRANFQREISVMMQFCHPYSVRLLAGSLEGPGRPCLVMEYIRGIDLDKLQEQEGRFTPERVGVWLGQLCQVLDDAHSCNILHHDLTPANLMLQNVDSDHESIKVMDFGLSSLMSAYFIPMEKLTSGKMTSIGGGTPDYMSPEQIRGEQIDHRSDLYSLGVVLYKFFTGRLPFQEYTEVSDILQAHLKNKPPTFAELGIEDMPPKLEPLINRLLTKYPHERFPHAKELAYTYQDVIGQRIVPDGAFEEPLPEMIAQEPRFRPEEVLDHFEAWMPESVAIMKLRAFVESIGGEIVNSEPGVIKLRILDPRSSPDRQEKRSFFSFGQKKAETRKFVNFDLFMDKREVGTRCLVDINLVLDPCTGISTFDKNHLKGFIQRICRELRAYMMIGR